MKSGILIIPTYNARRTGTGIDLTQLNDLKCLPKSAPVTYILFTCQAYIKIIYLEINFYNLYIYAHVRTRYDK